ncbi:hypothetical protein LINPERPRIM_LOCUS38370 [Linum perenne]
MNSVTMTMTLDAFVSYELRAVFLEQRPIPIGSSLVVRFTTLRQAAKVVIFFSGTTSRYKKMFGN